MSFFTENKFPQPGKLIDVNGHAIQLNKPELVVNTIRQRVEKVRYSTIE